MIRNRVQTILSIAAKDMRVGDKCGHAYRMEVDDIDREVNQFTGTVCARMKHSRLSGNRAKENRHRRSIPEASAHDRNF